MSYSTPVATDETRAGRLSRVAQIAAWLGLSLHTLLGVLYLLSGLLAPFWAVVGLWTLWTLLLAVAIQQRASRPIIAAVIPVVGLLVWVAVIRVVAITWG